YETLPRRVDRPAVPSGKKHFLSRRRKGAKESQRHMRETAREIPGAYGGRGGRFRGSAKLARGGKIKFKSVRGRNSIQAAYGCCGGSFESREHGTSSRYYLRF